MRESDPFREKANLSFCVLAVSALSSTKVLTSSCVMLYTLLKGFSRSLRIVSTSSCERGPLPRKQRQVTSLSTVVSMLAHVHVIETIVYSMSRPIRRGEALCDVGTCRFVEAPLSLKDWKFGGQRYAECNICMEIAQRSSEVSLLSPLFSSAGPIDFNRFLLPGQRLRIDLEMAFVTHDRKMEREWLLTSRRASERTEYVATVPNSRPGELNSALAALSTLPVYEGLLEF